MVIELAILASCSSSVLAAPPPECVTYVYNSTASTPVQPYATTTDGLPGRDIIMSSTTLLTTVPTSVFNLTTTLTSPDDVIPEYSFHGTVTRTDAPAPWVMIHTRSEANIPTPMSVSEADSLSGLEKREPRDEARRQCMHKFHDPKTRMEQCGSVCSMQGKREVLERDSK